MHSFANDAAVITLNTPDARLSSWYTHYGEKRVNDLLQNSSLNPFPESETDYQQILETLTSDPEALEAYIKAQNAFFMKHQETVESSGEFMENILEIINAEK